MDIIRVAIFDRFPLIIKGLEALLAQQNGIELVGKYLSRADIIKGFSHQVPDILIAEVQDAEFKGQEIISFIRANYQDTKLIVFTVFESVTYMKAMMRTGALGYLFKTSAEDEVLAAIKSVSQGQQYVQPRIKKLVLDKILLNKKVDPALPKLTKREKEILQLLASNLSSQDIAKKLFISKKTVENHRSNMLEKFKVKNAASLIKKAIEYDLLD